MKKNIYLGIETTTSIFSIVIGNEESILDEKVIEGTRHSELLVPAIEEILEKNSIKINDVTAVGVGKGPGSFTGIRVGLSTGITISQVLGIPVYGFSSMDIAGKKCRNPVIKAFRDKYYHAEYDEKGTRITEYGIIDESVKNKIGGVDADISAAYFLEEINNSKDNGKWQAIEPIYVMNTIYKPKKRN